MTPSIPQALSWPTSPERYFQACLNAVRQDIRNLNEKKIRLGPEPARRYAHTDRNLYQWGICARCRQQLSAYYAGPDREVQNAAALRWGLAAYMGRVCASSQWRKHFLENDEIPALEARREREIPLVMAETDRWRQTGHAAHGLVVREVTMELPLRIAGSVPSWQARDDPVPSSKIDMATLCPERSGNSRVQYLHRFVAGCAADWQDNGASARIAVDKTIGAITTLLSQDVRVWPPEPGGHWEYLYLSPADYASKKRVPPAASS